MSSPLLRSIAIALGLLMATLVGLGDGVAEADAPAGDTIPPVAPVLLNGDVECTSGYYTTTNAVGRVIHIPNHWQLVINEGAPKTHSARLNFTGGCGDGGHVERISGLDSILVEAQNLETPPEPGKPFDVSFHQQVTASEGGAYSFSGWLLSLCGGSAVPSDCPDGYYMAKMLGIDPTGGVDPLADTVQWVENRRNFWENGQRVGWANLYLSAVAEAPVITVFARVASPFQWHGNHGFIDALSLVRSPAASLAIPTRVDGAALIVIWDAVQSPDVAAIPGGNYKLLVDIQVRHAGAEMWADWVSGYEGSGSQVFTATCSAATYEFRVRARAEQPAGEDGAWPNQRYHGVWSDPVAVSFNPVRDPAPPPPGDHRAYLPLIGAYRVC